jgi:hypothetical protein
MIQGSYRETGAHGKWLDKSLAKSLQDINMKWPIDERDNTHIVKDGIRIACEDVCDSRLNGVGRKRRRFDTHKYGHPRFHDHSGLHLGKAVKEEEGSV